MDLQERLTSYIVTAVPGRERFRLRLLWSVALGLHALTASLALLIGLQALTVMIGLRALFGLGQAGAYAVLSRVTRFWFPLSVRTSVQGWIAVFAGRIGGASASVLFATLLIGTLHLPGQSGTIFLVMTVRPTES